MNTLAVIASVIGAIVLLAVTAGGVVAILRASEKEKTEERLRAENQDYVRRLEYVEPRLRTLERDNETLLKLHDPTDAADQSSEEHAQIVSILVANKQLLEAIDKRLHGEAPQ